MKDYKKLPNPVKEILGLLRIPVSLSAENGLFTLSSSQQEVKFTSGVKQDAPSQAASNGTGKRSSVSANSSSSSQTTSSRRVIRVDEEVKIMT